MTISLVVLYVGWLLLAGIWCRNRTRTREFTTTTPPAKVAAVFRAELVAGGWMVDPRPRGSGASSNALVWARRRPGKGPALSLVLMAEATGRRTSVVVGAPRAGLALFWLAVFRDPLASFMTELAELDPFIVVDRSFRSPIPP
jgi:hypothetical protein